MSPLYAAFIDLASAYDETQQAKREQAMRHLVRFTKAHSTGWVEETNLIAGLYGLGGQPAEVVRAGLVAAAQGLDVTEQPLEGPTE